MDTQNYRCTRLKNVFILFADYDTITLTTAHILQLLLNKKNVKNIFSVWPVINLKYLASNIRLIILKLF